jgi:2-polyprenyl-3-methyl-5-hydroxy-6-metoxy-1,4-benzoquinol methylase
MSIEPSKGPGDPRVLTQSDYWESGYVTRDNARPLEVRGFRNFSDRKIIETIEALGLEGKRILEVGAGDSAVLTHLAHQYRGRASFIGLDYSAAGCALLMRRAEREQAVVSVVEGDLFQPDSRMLGSFDVVYSYGVVEHFQNLSAVLLAKARFLSAAGRMLSIIPNMAGVLGALTRRYNKRVYELHVPHDLQSFLRGHADAGLEVLQAGYVCSSNFGVLASCFSSPQDRGWRSYVWLARLSKLLWFVEDALGELPHSGRFSPYIYVTSRSRVRAQ